MSFTYDDNGLRTSKTVNGVTTEYYWNGNLLVAEKTPYNLIVYNYDATGRPIGMAYRENGYTQYQWDVFWFDLNVFGDVVAVYDNNGTKLLTYTYDPWGYGEVGYVNGGEFSQAKRNRIAYRGYYYDSDLDLYYLQSRYYDPSTKRFINADGYISTGQGILGYNMFAYCGNNPINCIDPTGEAWWYWLCLIISPTVTEVLATANDIYQITRDDGDRVSVLENGDSVEIKNSNKIQTLGAKIALSFLYNHVSTKSSDVIKGSTYGVVVEWQLHNIAYDALSLFAKNSPWVDRAAQADVGKTIFSDDHGIASTIMHGFYIRRVIRHPISVIYDVFVEITGGN